MQQTFINPPMNNCMQQQMQHHQQHLQQQNQHQQYHHQQTMTNLGSQKEIQIHQQHLQIMAAEQQYPQQQQQQHHHHSPHPPQQEYQMYHQTHPGYTQMPTSTTMATTDSPTPHQPLQNPSPSTSPSPVLRAFKTTTTNVVEMTAASSPTRSLIDQGHTLANGGGGHHYTNLVTTSQIFSQCCTTSADKLLHSSSTTSTSSYSSTSSGSPSLSSSSRTSHDESNTPSCLSPTSSISNISEKQSTPSIGVNLRVTGQCSQGGRKYMEDYFSVAYQQSENAKDLEYAFIGIYDGHGGAEAATFAKEHLMMEIINQRLFWSDSDHDVLRAIREGYIATHYAMWRNQEKWPRTANGLPSTAGTTATVAFIRREKIYIGHVGDSGIVLGYQNENENIWRAKQLTVDHKPESVEERTRIMDSGGKVVVKSGVPRVVWNRPKNANHRGPIKHKTPVDEIPFLAVARSLGDLWSYNSQNNEFVVSPDPDVKVIPINAKTFRCLIFGTDGLWNVVSPQEAVNTVREKEMINDHLQSQRADSPLEGNQWTNPSKALVDQALKTWSMKKMRADNTSVVTVILYPPGRGGHNNNLHPSSNIAPPPVFAQSPPSSYGLEYSQTQAEVSGYESPTTYKEMAMKYLPPEEYRNFNYYSDDSDGAEENDTDESETEEEGEVRIKGGTADEIGISTNSLENCNFGDNNNWNWQQQQEQQVLRVYENSNEKSIVEEEFVMDDVEELEENGGDNNDLDDDEGVSNVSKIVNYQNYINSETNVNNTTDSYITTFTESYNKILSNTEQTVMVEPSQCDGGPHNMNSNSNSSSSNCQSVTPPNMHSLIEEQQLYQQQCMSEEEGYSLTKLETRREQQNTCKLESHPHDGGKLPSPTGGVETFKIFHQPTNPTSNPSLHQNPNLNHNHIIVPEETTDHMQQISSYTPQSERYFHHHHLPVYQSPSKPLELHSLLQQEREEEQQVAYERQQMQNQQIIGVHHQLHTSRSPNSPHSPHSVTTYACLQELAQSQEPEPTSSTSPHSLVYNSPATTRLVDRPNRIATTNPLDVDNDALLAEVDEVAQELEALEKAENEHSVQINEISSSSYYGGEMENEVEMDDNNYNEIVLQPSSGPPLRVKEICYTNNQRKQTFVVPNKNNNELSPRHMVATVECLPTTSMVTKVAENRNSLPNSNTKQYITANNPSLNLTANQKPNPRNIERRARSFVFSKGSNENLEREIGGCCQSPSTRVRRSLSMTPSAILREAAVLSGNLPVAKSTPINSCRQLRSNTSRGNCNLPSSIDYGKRTLRTRNCMTKDLKAKTKTSTLGSQASYKYPNYTNGSRRFIRPTIAAAAVLLLQKHKKNGKSPPPPFHPSNNISESISTNGVCISNHGIKCTRNSATNTLSAESSSLSPTGVNSAQLSHSIVTAHMHQQSHHINLRSRQSSTVPMLNQSQLIKCFAENTTDSSTQTLPRTPPKRNCSSPVIKPGNDGTESVDRHFVHTRSIHTRSSSKLNSSISSVGMQTTSFSKKTTRSSQGPGTNIAAPPPSPKMINAVEAVAAATRARSLMAKKQENNSNVAAAVGTRSQMVTTIFRKKISLRSSSRNNNRGNTSLTGTVSVLPIRAENGPGGVTKYLTLRRRVIRKFER